MNRREMFKAIIGTAVAAAVPSMPFRWRELTYTQIMRETIVTHQGRIAASVMKNNALISLLQQKIENTRRDIVWAAEHGSLKRPADQA